VQGIPYIFINGVHHDGDPTFEALKAKIDPLLG
jgi:glutaredoxin